MEETRGEIAHSKIHSFPSLTGEVCVGGIIPSQEMKARREKEVMKEIFFSLW